MAPRSASRAVRAYRRAAHVTSRACSLPSRSPIHPPARQNTETSTSWEQHQEVASDRAGGHAPSSSRPSYSPTSNSRRLRPISARSPRRSGGGAVAARRRGARDDGVGRIPAAPDGLSLRAGRGGGPGAGAAGARGRVRGWIDYVYFMRHDRFLEGVWGNGRFQEPMAVAKEPNDWFTARARLRAEVGHSQLPSSDFLGSRSTKNSEPGSTPVTSR